MRRWVRVRSGFALLMLSAVPAAAASEDVRGYITHPAILRTLDGSPVLDDSNRPIEIENGLLFVPENRRNPDSRTIAVHFMRLPAAEPGEHELAPIFVLPGGPGHDYASNFGDEAFDNEARLLRRKHDVVYVSQRGYPGAPGFTAPLWSTPAPVPLNAEWTNESRSHRATDAFGRAMEEWTRRGVDLRGYDILNIVDDVYDLRAALGYDRIMLRGCSFGSQWSLAYMKRWPDTVDRAILSGVEPLDYAYDSPAGLWASLNRLADRAENDSELAPHIPDDGLLEALKTVIGRLEEAPEAVTIQDRESGRPVTVVVGADDARRMVVDAYAFANDDAREGYVSWPRLILELYRGDYRYLAAYSYEVRTMRELEPMIMLLIDNSLAISKSRDERLLAEPEARWLGDINLKYRTSRAISPAPDTGDAFRAFQATQIPVLMIHGDLDWSTPVENAEAALPWFTNGHLVVVEGGSHCSEIRDGEIMQHLPAETGKLYGFLEVDFDTTTAYQYFGSLPERLELPALRFNPPAGPSLYDEWLSGE